MKFGCDGNAGCLGCARLRPADCLRRVGVREVHPRSRHAAGRGFRGPQTGEYRSCVSTYRGVAAAAVAVVGPACRTGARSKADIVFGLSQSGNQIVAFNTNNPSQILLSNTVTGPNGAGTLVGIDFRAVGQRAASADGSGGNGGRGAVFLRSTRSPAWRPS